MKTSRSGCGKRERPQEQAVDEAEDRDVRGDAEREHQDDERGGAALAQQGAPGVTDIGTGHERRPFVDVDGERHALGPEGREPGLDQIGDRAQPDRGCGAAAPGAGGREAFGEELLHVGAVPRAQAPRRQRKKRAVDAIHRASPVRTRDRARRARRPRRSASSVSTRRPPRVSR